VDLDDLQHDQHEEILDVLDAELEAQETSTEVDTCDTCGPCDDENLCTENDEWSQGTCVGTPVSCDDGNECTMDICVPALGCVASELAISCDDGDPCTAPDFCVQGSCTGTLLPNCGNPVCGDGWCQGDETCATCPSDCSPVGGGTCDGPCDPTVQAPVCAENHACLPTLNGALFPDPFFFGHGGCGIPCTGPGDCPGGLCVTITGFEAPGQCALACDPANPLECVGLVTCFPLASNPAQGACLAAETCEPDHSAGCPCHEAPGLATEGVCLVPCLIQDPHACWDGMQDCLIRTAAEWHEGTCVGQTSPCDVAAQAGCLAGQSCLPVAGPGVSGSALVCFDAPGSLTVGESCVAHPDGCAPGLLCAEGVCQRPCDPANVACPGGVCQDAGGQFGLVEGVVGLCLPDCGDASCAEGENCLSCPQDCGACVESCGDGMCIGEEGCESCPEDCPCPACGDGPCDGEEDCSSCPEDCGSCPVCSDGLCQAGESCESCPEDCGSCIGVCGDGQCSMIEFCFSCPADCGACPDTCGDGACAAGETCVGCPADCGVCPGDCGDGECDPGETCVTCPTDCLVLGLVCQENCDPTLGPKACAGERACVPTAEDLFFAPPFHQGNGVCGAGCEGSGDCAGDACVKLTGLAATGMCAAACGVSEDCPTGWSCVTPPGTSGDGGACFPGPACSAEGSCPGDGLLVCTALENAGNAGVCLPRCWAQDPAACPGEQCLVRTDPVWHSGRCVGLDPPCDPVSQTGCGALESCLMLGGSALGGQAFLCAAGSGGVGEGEDCEPGDCAPGLACLFGSCFRHCIPSEVGCPVGVCVDISQEYYLPEGTMGVCLPAG
jgi:hypothetical protein